MNNNDNSDEEYLGEDKKDDLNIDETLNLIEPESNDNRDDMTIRLVLAPLTREDVAKVFNDKELEEYLKRIKTDALSLKADDINDGLARFNKLVLGNVDVSQMDVNVYNTFMKVKVSGVEELQDTYDVIVIGKEYYDMLKGVERNNISIETIRKRTEKLYRKGAIDEEQMAFCYHNVALLFDDLATAKSSYSRSYNDKNFVCKYMVKALNMTNNLELIQTCTKYIPEKTKNMRKMLQNALDRALKNKENDNPLDRFQIYCLYAESFERYSDDKIGFLESNVRDNDAYYSMIYYEEALKYASTKDDEIKILRNIAKKQKDFDKYTDTMVRIIETSQGRQKIMEIMRFVVNDKIDDEMKISLYETAVNELIDDKYIIKAEKNLLWKNIKGNLVKLYDRNTKKLNKLKIIEDRYFSEMKTKRKARFSKKSSVGKDYFSR